MASPQQKTVNRTVEPRPLDLPPYRVAVQPADGIQCWQRRPATDQRDPTAATRSRFVMLFCHGGSFASTARNDTSGAFWESTLSQFGHDQNKCNIIQNLVEEIGRVLMMNNSIRIWNRRRVVNPKPGVADHTLPMLNFRMTGKHFYVWGLQNI